MYHAYINLSTTEVDWSLNNASHLRQHFSSRAKKCFSIIIKLDLRFCTRQSAHKSAVNTVEASNVSHCSPLTRIQTLQENETPIAMHLTTYCDIFM